MVEPSVQLSLSHQFEQQQTQKLIEIINKNPHLIFEVFEVFPEVLLSHDPQKIENTFECLEGLIKAFGISFVLQLNTFDIVTLFETLMQQGWEKKINKLLELCLVTFSFDKERTNIELLANLWIAHNLTASSFPAAKVTITPFITLFCNLQKIFAQSQNIANMTPEDKKAYATHIREALKNENFENDEFNNLEKDLAIYYHNELISTLSVIEPKSSVKYVSEIENEIKAVILNSQNPVNKETPQPQPPSPIGKNSVPLPQYRTSFMLGERISEDESIKTEYKEYSIPFGDIVEKTLKKTIGAFLNRRGGRIYIGVSDSKIVKGIFLKFKDRDLLRLQIQNMLRYFEPSVINKERIRVVEVPVRNPKDKEIIPGCFVLKIIIKQGDPSKLFSVNDRTYESYIRNHGQNTSLTAREIAEYIIQRSQNPDPVVPDEEFNDPQPDDIEDIYEQKEGEGLSTSKILYDQTAKRRNAQNPPNLMNAPIIKSQVQDKSKPNVQNDNKNQPNVPNAMKNQQNVQNVANPNSNPANQNNLYQKRHAVFVKGLPPLTQQQFNTLINKMGYKTLFMHRMFKFIDGTCNGKAFLNFEDLQEAKHLINSWNNKKIENCLVSAELQYPAQKK